MEGLDSGIEAFGCLLYLVCAGKPVGKGEQI